ncbi:hypothetical protein [Adhaeribacter pallidiroseus]|uniref:Uncharacterized protein n=1 Tax=Adhaeribacter pallidiroseus TaxID=2072847 RepID=A0A369Q1L8_9BACT|nr:hypothetical protein [Adhaeribacter pallidiroseus]RDC58821.1 hypothetical protein AHMF7616_05255 [Adhaeribacter pallidiroseus]
MKIELPNAFGNIFISISYDAPNGWVYNNWQGYQTLESVMQGANACLEIIQKYNCSRLFIFICQITPIMINRRIIVITTIYTLH